MGVKKLSRIDKEQGVADQQGELWRILCRTFVDIDGNLHRLSTHLLSSDDFMNDLMKWRGSKASG